MQIMSNQANQLPAPTGSFMHEGVEYPCVDEQREIEICFSPRIAGPLVGYNAELDLYLCHLTTPYGKNSDVYSVLRGDFVRFYEANQ